MIRPRVLLADDHAPLLEAFQRFLVEDCDIVGVVTDGREVVAAAMTLRPDVIVMDVTMRHCNGLEATRQLKRDLPETRVVLLTMYDESDLAAEAFRAGASGYLLKRSSRTELLPAIREVMHDRFYVTPQVAESVAGTAGRHAGAADTPLTPSQREIVRLVAAGHSAKDVAARLEISPRTVVVQKARIMRQLNVRTTTALIQYAVAHRIV